jgi:CheY-like chemotaxis protein/two-component sensor histidine kinase
VHAELQGILADAEQNIPQDNALISRVRDAIQAQSEIAVSAQRIARIVADLSGFARPVARTANCADVRRSLAWAVRTTSHELRQRARVVTDVAEVPAVALDETRLGQVLVNLLVNAAHAIAEGAPERNTVTVSGRLGASGCEVVIEVRDTGSGMPASVRERVFEPFFTTKPVGEGTGLGLSVCHGIVRSAGGTLEVESTVGVGSVFRLSLPVAEPSAPSVAPDGAASRLRARVLAIDDEKLVLHTISRCLAPHHEVTCLTNASDALERIERGDTFDLILLDLSMPGMTGMEFYNLRQQRKPETCRHIVFLSGGATTPRVAEFLASAPNARLDKPFSLVALRALVQSTLAPAGSAA